MRIFRKRDRYWIDLRTRFGRIRMQGYEAKRPTEALGRNIEELASLREAGERPGRDLREWIDSLSPDMQARLAKHGLLSDDVATAAKPLAKHLDDWKAHLEAKDASPRHISQAVARVKALAKAKTIRSLSDFTIPKVEGFLRDLREKEGLSPTTANRYLQSIKAFLNWGVSVGMLSENPVARVKRANENIDIRRERRALSEDEIQWLLYATERTEEHHTMTGPDRALLYRVALETGLRWSEIRSLARDSLDLDGTPPTVTVAASDSKNRKADTLPLRPATAALLADHTRLSLPTAKVFSGMQKCVGAKMLRHDMHAARNAWLAETGRDADDDAPFLQRETGEGTVDFHALRHTFLSRLARSGVHPSVAQRLARHSDVNLTLSRYTHAALESRAEAVAALPDLDTLPAEMEAISTGTDDADASGKSGARIGAPTCAKERKSTDNHGQSDPAEKGCNRNEKSPENPHESRLSGGCVSGAGEGSHPLFSQSPSLMAESRNPIKQQDLTEDAAEGGARIGALSCIEGGLSDPDLAAVVGAWPALPESIRKVILGMVRAFVPDGDAGGDAR